VTYSSAPCVNGSSNKVPITDNAIMESPRPRGYSSAQPGRPYSANSAGGDASASGVGGEDQRARLSSECDRGFKQSCSALRRLNHADDAGAPDSQTARLTEECSRGFKRSCETLRTINKEMDVVCNSSGAQSGTTVGGYYSGTYAGNTRCRNR